MGALTQAVFGAVGPLFTKTIPEGAATEVFCAVNPKATAFDGAYLADCNTASCRAEGNDPALARKLWEVSESIVAICRLDGNSFDDPLSLFLPRFALRFGQRMSGVCDPRGARRFYLR